ncbi:MAG TPA: SusE domain-containing protein [Chitinophagaceae bacterium]|nr:SusE domain-containing protein [Chitinophagaceae bacterium]
MKTLLNKILLVGFASLALWSCKKDETRAILTTGAAPTLTASKTTVVLSQAAEKDTAIVFTWNDVDFGFKDALKYTLQIAKAGTNFVPATTTEIAVTKNNMRQAMTVADFNRELNKILPTGTASQIEVRLKSDVAGVFSNVLPMTVTPYRVLITYGYPQAINVAGSFQNWTPGTAPQIVSMSNDQKYEGFIDFGTTTTPEFKFVKGNDWPAGDFGSAGAGKLGGSANLSLTSGGVQLIKADTKALTWSAAKINSWGIIGDAVPVTGWDSDKDLTYNAATKTYTITLDLIGGKNIKFRANDAWDIDLGDNGNDGKPELGGSNIPVPASGNYTVTLDILTGGNWSYTLKKN